MHAACGLRMAELGVNYVIGVRGLAGAMVDAAEKAGLRGLFVETPEEVGAWMAENLREGDTVLLKASRGVRLEKALVALA